MTQTREDPLLAEWEAANAAFYDAYVAWEADGYWDDGWIRNETPALVAARDEAAARVERALNTIKVPPR